MKDTIRKIVVDTKKVPKSVLVVTNTARMLPRMEGIRALGYECAVIEGGGGAMHFLQAGKRVNAVVLDLKSAEGAEKLIRWIGENRPGIIVICILNADLADFGSEAAGLGAVVLAEEDVDKIPELLRNLISQQAR